MNFLNSQIKKEIDLVSNKTIYSKSWSLFSKRKLYHAIMKILHDTVILNYHINIFIKNIVE